MEDLANYEVYKITNHPTASYIFSVTEYSENEEETNYRYYTLTTNSDQKPKISEVFNTIEILSSEALILEKVEPESEEFQTFTITLSSIIPVKVPSQSSLFSSLQLTDLKLLEKTRPM